MYRSIMLSAAAFALVAGTVSAEAACGVPQTAQAAQIKLPPLKPATRPSGDSIVGFWQVSLIVDGQVVLHTMKTWHEDGTEYDNADLPPTGGNVCGGAWVNTGHRKVHNVHYGWTFDANSNPSGMFIETEDDKVARDGNSYTGPFDQKFYDVNGQLVNELSGTVSATRVSAE
ncbi:MAG TPA: hypothetical protein VHW69_05435 [Rhizomicrobium sp.]|jgi:hypothetical protein|nr:hypothetical protein [Rhizomicrobium sp.]